MPPRVQKITSVSVPLVADIASCCSGIFFALATCSRRATTSGWLQPPWVSGRAPADPDIAVLRSCSRSDNPWRASRPPPARHPASANRRSGARRTARLPPARWRRRRLRPAICPLIPAAAATPPPRQTCRCGCQTPARPRDRPRSMSNSSASVIGSPTADQSSPLPCGCPRRYR